MDFSFSELFLVGAIAYLILGPEQFIEKSQAFGRFIGRAKTQMNNFKVMAQEEATKERKSEDSSGVSSGENSDG